MTTKGYIIKNAILNRKDVKTFYSKNSAKVQKQRAVTRLNKGFTVRDSTLKKYNIERVEEEDSDMSTDYDKITLKQMQTILNEMEGKTSTGVQRKNYSSKFKIFFIDANACDAGNLNNCFDKDPKEMVENLLEYGKEEEVQICSPWRKICQLNQMITSWLGAPCGAHASISQIIYYTKIEKCWCKRSKDSRHLPVLKHIA